MGVSTEAVRDAGGASLVVRRVNDASRLMYIECKQKCMILVTQCVRVRISTRPPLTGDRVTDHATDPVYNSLGHSS